MPALTVRARYVSPSGAHEVVVIHDRDDRWQVVDRGATDFTLVETLTGHDDRFDQAIAVADDYAAQQQAFHDGRREDDPLPRPSQDPRRAERGMSRDPAGRDGSPRSSPSVPPVAQSRRPAIDPAHARCSSATLRDGPTTQTHAMRLEGEGGGTLTSALDPVVHVGDIVLSLEDPGALQLDLLGSKALEQTAPLAEEHRDDMELDLVEDAGGKCALRGPAPW